MPLAKRLGRVIYCANPRQISRRATNPPPDLQVERPGQPEDGHESRTWQFGVGSRDDRAFAEYGLRMAYHDLADNAYGFPLGAQIESASSSCASTKATAGSCRISTWSPSAR